MTSLERLVLEMPQLRNAEEPAWPAHLAEYRGNDGWESRLDWEITRVKWARANGFKGYRMLPLMQRLAQKQNPERGKTNE
jgi:hypothetical protein